MSEWWEALTGFERVLWILAIPSSLIFLIQSVATFMGMDADGGMDADIDTDGDDGPFQLFTFRNMINFFLGFSWTGITLYDSIENHFILGLVAFVVGVVLVFLVMMIFVQMAKMAQSGTMNYENAVGQTCEVYLSIPAKNAGRGKVHIRIQGALRELDAVSNDQAIPSGTQVKVIALQNENLLLVEKI